MTTVICRFFLHSSTTRKDADDPSRKDTNQCVQRPVRLRRREVVLERPAMTIARTTLFLHSFSSNMEPKRRKNKPRVTETDTCTAANISTAYSVNAFIHEGHRADGREKRNIRSAVRDALEALLWTQHPLARHNCARTALHRTHCTSTVTHHGEHAWLKANTAQVGCFGVSEVVCHPSVMSYMLPHLSQNSCTGSLLYSDLLLPHCPVLRNWIKKPCEIHCGVVDVKNLHLPHFSEMSHLCDPPATCLGAAPSRRTTSPLSSKVLCK